MVLGLESIDTVSCDSAAQELTFTPLVSFETVCQNSKFSLWLEPNFIIKTYPHLKSPVKPGKEAADSFISLFENKHVLEIAGLTEYEPFRHLYLHAAKVDNIISKNQPEAYVKSQYIHDKDKVIYDGKILGQIFYENAEDFQLSNNQYDILFASHVLEHLRDPIRSLRNWASHLRPGGIMVLVLPSRENCFDKHRPPDTMLQLIMKFHEAKKNYYDIGVEQAIRSTDVSAANRELMSHSPCVKSNRGCGVGDFQEAWRTRFHKNNEFMHYHVFDFDLIVQLLQCMGMEILKSNGLYHWKPYHQVVIAKKP